MLGPKIGLEKGFLVLVFDININDVQVSNLKYKKSTLEVILKFTIVVDSNLVLQQIFILEEIDSI